MTKKRVSINGITRWKEINPAPQQVAPVVEEAKTVPAVENILIPPIEKLFAIDIMNLR